MLKEQDHGQHLEKVETYYKKAQKFYEWFWYWGGRGLGLHYGLWMEGVENRIGAIIKENEVLADYAIVKSGDYVLDAGSGVSGSGIWLAQNRKAHVTSLNIVENQLKRGKRLATKKSVDERLDFTRADYHYLPYSSESFDVFWSLESIEHSDNVGLFIDESIRVLKNGGKAVIAGTFKGDTNPTSEQQSQLAVGMEAAGAFNDFRGADEICGLMRSKGYKDVRNYNVTEDIMPSAREMRIMCEIGLPFARLGHSIGGLVSDVMVKNTQWGIYQENLFKFGVTSYNIIVAQKS